MIELIETNAAGIAAEFVAARLRAGSPAMGMVMTLVIVVDEDHAPDAMARRPAGVPRAPGPGARRDPRRRPRRAADQRPGRHRRRLDRRDRADPAQGRGGQALRVGGAAAAAARLPGRRCGGRRDAPEDPATDPLGRLAQRRITDAAVGASAARAGRSTSSARRTPPATPTSPGPGSRRGAPCSPPRSTSTSPSVTGGSVTAERISPSAELLVAWLADRLKVKVERKNSSGPGITEARLETKDGPIVISRRDGRLATFSSPGRPDRPVALKRRAAPRAARRGAAPARRGRRSMPAPPASCSA